MNCTSNHFLDVYERMGFWFNIQQVVNIFMIRKKLYLKNKNDKEYLRN